MANVMQISVPMIYQQGWDPQHFHQDVREYLNAKIPRRRIGHASQDNSPLPP